MFTIPDEWRDVYAIDLGTANVSISRNNKLLTHTFDVKRKNPETGEEETVSVTRPIAIPSFIAYDKRDKDPNVKHECGGRVLHIGYRAKNLWGRSDTRGRYHVVRLVKHGQIVDPDAVFDFITVLMKTYYPEVSFNRMKPQPIVLAGVPPNAEKHVRRMIISTLMEAMRAYKVILISQTMAAAVGCGIANVEEDESVAICDIGGGTTDISIIDERDMVYRETLYVGGDKMNEAIVEFMKNQGITIGFNSAELAKINCGSAIPLEKLNGSAPPLPYFTVEGRAHMNVTPYNLTTDEIYSAISSSVESMVREINDAVLHIPVELIGPMRRRGLVLTGGGALLRGLREKMMEATKLPIMIPDDADVAVILGLYKLVQKPKLRVHVMETETA